MEEDNGPSKKRKTVARKPLSQDEKQRRSNEKKEQAELMGFSHYLNKTFDLQFWQSNKCTDLRRWFLTAQSHPERFPMQPSDAIRINSQAPDVSVLEAKKNPALLSAGLFTF
jgi:hypothetical protein